MPFAVVVLLLFASTALRLPGTFLYPSFWAEDLTILFKDSIEMGPAALGQPIYGSYHTIPRLLALAASLTLFGCGRSQDPIIATPFAIDSEGYVWLLGEDAKPVLYKGDHFRLRR